MDKQLTVSDAPPPPEYPRPMIVRNCARCHVTDTDVARNAVIVSPRGVAHFGNGGDTECGHDATRVGWWWPL